MPKQMESPIPTLVASETTTVRTAVKHTTTALNERAAVLAISGAMAAKAAEWCVATGNRERAAESSGLFQGVLRGKIRKALLKLERGTSVAVRSHNKQLMTDAQELAALENNNVQLSHPWVGWHLCPSCGLQ